VARIFHGITSPAYPTRDWSRCREWGAYTAHAFQDVMRVAGIILARRRQREGAAAAGAAAAPAAAAASAA
jgi:hypothetical protein